MSGVVSKRIGLFFATLAVTVGMAAVAAPAEARSRHRGHIVRHHSGKHIIHQRRHRGTHFVRTPSGGPPFAAIVVDGATGKMIYGRSENELRHPASITKVMTLYLLFEQMEKGRFSLDSELSVSAHAAAQSPSKLGLRPGSTIEVDDAIKAIVTKSANDIAVTVAEAVGGDEDTFAEMMTAKARALGMSRTVYRNASGLPNPQQVTTAHDLAILGRSIQERFPKYYRYFSTRTFNFAGRSHPNHNHLLGQVEGMDGIKTGYTAASGFNLLTSVKRDGHHVIGVVLGGRTGRSRDQIMAGLIEDHIESGGRGKTQLAFADNARDDDETPPPRVEPARAETRAAVEPMRLEPIRAEAARPAAPRAEQARVADTRSEGYGLQLSVPPAPIAVERARAERPRPAYVAAVARTPSAADADNEKMSVSSIRGPVTDGSTTRRATNAAATVTSTPSMRWVAGAKPLARPQVETVKVASKDSGNSQISRQAAGSDKRPTSTETRPAKAGWMIQIGATDNLSKASDLLSRAKIHSRSIAQAQGFTEKVQKGNETLWRARFAGLQENSAETACKELKRSGFSCFATKN